ncbi:hypothetical protein DP939_43315 [Spongiactinospora rosea]|uniref:Transposase InsH N-terminal domain-containing protein n=1 Tax=Spongiactinospora rosea TaxID=2248750 RepID=A0A366LL79_9ACTN|nr:hypothetical protein DP939_43315 [Spongiactinospora rosea]
MAAGTRTDSGLAQALSPKGCLAMRVRDQLRMLFADEDFAFAFGRRGRPGMPPGQLALVSVMQFAENLTDRQAAHAVRSRIDWKFLQGLELADAGCEFTVLHGFRDCLLCHGQEIKILDLMLAKLSPVGDTWLVSNVHQAVARNRLYHVQDRPCDGVIGDPGGGVADGDHDEPFGDGALIRSEKRLDQVKNAA